MSKLEDIKIGSRVKGISLNEAVTVIATEWYGESVLGVSYKTDNGALGEQLIYRDSECEIEIMTAAMPWDFDADGDKMRLASEAYRINLAHLFDPYLAIHTSSIDPLPHQISAVYQEMLPRLPLRYVLADDPGAGKTIMTGLLIKELMIRGDLKRCLIVTPGSLSEQWQDELYNKFHIKFEILTNDRIKSAVSGNIFTEMNFCIARLDKLARDESLQAKLKITEWDMVICDEAHKLSATVWGGEVKYTKRFQLGRLLSNITRNFLLLTATPHNGKQEDFQLFMSLIDQDRFEGAARTSNQEIDVSDVMRRLVKEELLKFDGTPLFPERRAYTVNYDLSENESMLYKQVTEYVRDEFNRADNLNKERKTTVGFALTVLQRRLASSPEAIYQSLKRRRQRLENRLAEERIGKRAEEYTIEFNDDFDEDDWTADEAERNEEKVTDSASAASTIAELEAEIDTLKQLEGIADAVRSSGEDRKWEELSKLLQDEINMFGVDGKKEKLIVFTEHKDTLRYLADKIRSLCGNPEAVVTIQGGMLRDERRKIEELFKQDVNTRILIATDAAGEGINLQRAHLMINYDLPWNPNRLEQRFGRIHRIGQTEVCHLWNLVSVETREGAVFQRLFEKLEEERNALGGKVFDILGKMTFNNKPLRDLLIEAVRYGNDPEVRERMWQVVDSSMDTEALKKLLDERALADDTMDVQTVMEIREEMERIEARKLQPHFIESFFIEAFKSVGGAIRPREKGRYEITNVPWAVRNRNMQLGFGQTVLKRYERVCFEKSLCNIPGLAVADLLCPGHPLLDAVIDLVRERNSDILKRGAIFVDERDYSTEPRLLFYVEDSIQDGTILSNGNHRVISKRVHFVDVKEDGTAASAGYAPYLDYRAVKDNEKDVILKYARSQEWLTSGIEERAKRYAIAELIPGHLAGVKERRQKIADKTARLVKERLTAEIQYWDYRAVELKAKESAGKINARLNSDNAQRRADELAGRLQKRLGEIAVERIVTPVPPVIIGGALVIPIGLLYQLTGTPVEYGHGDRRAVEIAAMNAVMEIERSLGYTPKDVSRDNCGYDIESAVPKEKWESEGTLRFIEVKGRHKGAETVTITKNEILCGRNQPDKYYLAIVEVDGENTETTYLRKMFRQDPDFAATSINYNIKELMNSSETVYRSKKNGEEKADRSCVAVGGNK